MSYASLHDDRFSNEERIENALNQISDLEYEILESSGWRKKKKLKRDLKAAKKLLAELRRTGTKINTRILKRLESSRRLPPPPPSRNAS